MKRSAAHVVSTLFVLACAAVFAGPAWAGVDLYMDDQGLSAGNAFASVSAHSGVTLTRGEANHTFCPALATGYSGYTSSPSSGGNNTYFNPDRCGYNYQEWALNAGTTQFYHGAVWNRNVSTFDFFNYAVYQW